MQYKTILEFLNQKGENPIALLVMDSEENFHVVKNLEDLAPEYNDSCNVFYQAPDKSPKMIEINFADGNCNCYAVVGLFDDFDLHLQLDKNFDRDFMQFLKPRNKVLYAKYREALLKRNVNELRHKTNMDGGLTT